MATVSELVFKAAFGDLVEAKGVLKDLKENTDKAADSAEKLEGKLSLAGKAGLAFGAAIGTGLTALIAMTKSGLEYADSINEQAERTNVSTEALSGWVYGAKQAGVAQSEMESALIKLNKQMDEAYSGSKTASEAFERLGISVTDSKGELKDTETVFYEVADAFKDIESGASKTAVAADIFGKAVGPALVPYLSQGKEGIEGLNKEALKFGLIITNDVGKAADQFGDKMDSVRGIVKGMETQMAAGLLPTLSKFQEALLTAANDGVTMNKAVAALDAGLKILWSTGLVVVRVFDGLGTAIGAAGAMISSALSGDWAGVKRIYNELEKDNQEAAKRFKESWSNIWSDTAAKVESEAPKHGKKLAAPATEAKEKVKKEVDEIEQYLKRLEGLTDPTFKFRDELRQIAEAEKRQGADLEMLAKRRDQVTEALFRQLGAETEEEKAIREKAESVEKLMEKYRLMADPLRAYDLQLVEIQKLRKEEGADLEMLSQAEDALLAKRSKAAEKLKETGEEQSDLMKDLIRAAEGYGQKMSSAFVDWMSGAQTSFSQMVRNMITEIAKLIMYQAVIKPMMNSVMGAFGFNNGGVFNNGAPQAFADGLVSSPTLFPMSNGATGMAGEAGTEAIMPLRRDASGRLGVVAASTGGFQVDAININISNVTSKDAPAVSEAAKSGVDRAIRGMVQSEIFNQTRLGNSLNQMPLTAF